MLKSLEKFSDDTVALDKLANIKKANRITSYNVCYTKLLRLPGFRTINSGRVVVG